MAEDQSAAERVVRLGFPDIDGLLALSGAVDWPHTREDWQTILLSGLVFGVREAGEGTPVLACAALFPYGPDACALGMVMVAGSQQRRGLGRLVVRRCLDARPNADLPVYLATTPQGEGLYRALDFRSIGHLAKMLADRAPAADDEALPEGWRLVPRIAMADFVAVLRRDRRAFGAARDAFLKHRLGQAERRASLLDADGALLGYGLGVRQGDLLILGPVAAEDERAALALIRGLAAGHDGPLRIDLTDPWSGLQAPLERLGFVLADRPPVMALGADGPPGDGWRGYPAIAAQAFL
jgi:hypothetical protein